MGADDLRTWHIADISDVLQLAKPDSILGFLQDTGTQKVLFEQPHIPIIDALSPAGSVPGIQLPNPPNFADVASLLNATGLFPDLSSTISLSTGATEQLNTLHDGLQYSKTYKFDKMKPPLTLLDLGVIKGNIGDQNYALAGALDLAKYRAVSIWCKRFSMNFGAAALRPTQTSQN